MSDQHNQQYHDDVSSTNGPLSSHEKQNNHHINHTMLLPEEDGPILRSVTMLSRPAPSTMLPSRFDDYPTAMTTTTFDDHRKLPPVLSQPSPKPYSYQTKPEFSLESSSRNASSHPSVPGGWEDVDHLPVLLAVPQYYQLSRTHVIISAAVLPLSIITIRLGEILRDESIAAQYDTTEAKVYCEAICGTRFVVRFWDNNVKENHSIIVECQRQSGCSYTCCQLVKRILKYVKTGKKKATTTAPRGGFPAPRPVPSSFRSMSSTAALRIPHQPADPTVQVADILETAMTMLLQHTNRLDLQLLAVESILHLVSNSSCTQTGLAMLLERAELMDRICAILTIETAVSDTTMTPIEKESLTLIRRKTVSVIKCCIDHVTTTDKNNDRSRAIVSNLFTRHHLIQPLIQMLTDAAIQPHEASDACQCLYHLLMLQQPSSETTTSTPDVIYRVVQEQIITKQCGHTHAGLYQSAHLLLGHLKQEIL